MTTSSMRSLNVLDRAESVQRHAILEASAGTGKTFAIENIVARLLIEPRQDASASQNGSAEPIPIEEILVVTFTRAATRELKERIRANLQRNLEIVQAALQGNEIPTHCPDFLLSHLEQGKVEMSRVRRCLEQALYAFDRAQIFTIHAFCWRMLKNYALEAQISLAAVSKEEQTLSTSKLRRAIRDFLHTQLSLPEFSTQQLKILMKSAGNKAQKLEDNLYHAAARGIDVIPAPAFSTHLEHFKAAMSSLQSQYAFNSDAINADFHCLAESYKTLHTNKKLKQELSQKLARFSSLFDKHIWDENDFETLIRDGLFYTDCFAEKNLKAKKTTPSQQALQQPNFFEIIEKSLGPIVEQARSEASIFSRTANACQLFIREFQKKNEMIGHDDLLIEMRRSIDIPAFASKVRKSYQAAIVDEFQDTDPIQWEIFSQLFANFQAPWNGYLQLVGDPKQSIYAFRQADIYTYLTAVAKLGPDAHATLDTNYRSQPLLVESLNTLFSAMPDIFGLPRTSSTLAFRHVKAGKTSSYGLSDPSACLQFWIARSTKAKSPIKDAEQNYFLPAIADEIIKLHKEHQLSFSQFAILIADKHQGNRVSAYLKSRNIPVKVQKTKELTDSHAVEDMRELLNGILHFNSRNALNTALSGPLIGMTHNELQVLENDDRLLPILHLCHNLKETFTTSGFAQFYDAFMRSRWSDKSVFETLLRQKEGHEYYRAWQDLADLLTDEQHARNLSPHALITFLDNLDILVQNEDERLQIYSDPDEEGVSLLTTHVSKGLEFDIVFSLGMTKRHKDNKMTLVPILQGTKQVLKAPNNNDDPHFLSFCREKDAEKMRQLYVAFTRAKYRLYAPIVLSVEEVPFGSASPMDLLLAKLDRPATSYTGYYERVAQETGDTLLKFAAAHPHLIGCRSIEKQEESLLSINEKASYALTPPHPVTLPATQQMIQSFTSLACNQEYHAAPERADYMPPHDFITADKSEHTLPSGNEIGLLLHSIFEHLPYHLVKTCRDAQAFREHIIPYTQGTPFEAWIDVIARIVYHALMTPLPNSNPPFCLADIDPKMIFRESEFLYPVDSSQGLFDISAVKPGFLKGVIDLFILHQGKYYLIDWKSNWIGPTQAHYSHENMLAAMLANRYDLQAAIYLKAMQRYLKLFDHRPFESIFGGTYYLFVRGIGTNSGILNFEAKS